MWIELILIVFFRSVEGNTEVPDSEILIKKCCAYEEYLIFDDKGVGTCKPLEGVAATEQLLNRVEQILNRGPLEPTELAWLPKEFRTKGAGTRKVKYSQKILCPRSHALFIGSSETNRYRIGKKGSLVFMANTTGGHIVQLPFSNREYCIDEAIGFKSPHVYMICPCERTRCIPKCCAINRVLNFRGDVVECKFVRDLDWKPFLNDVASEKDITYTVLDYQFPDCEYRLQHKEEMHWPDKYVHSWFNLSKGRVFENKDVCTDFLWHDAAPLTRTIATCALTPHVAGVRKHRAIRHLIASILLGISIIALVHHAKRCTIHILSLCSYIFSLFFYHILLASTLWPAEPLFPCRTIGFFIYYFTLSSATWLSIAAFNTTLNYRDLIDELPDDQRKWYELAFCYLNSLYAWGVPGFFVGFTHEYLVRDHSAIPQDTLLPTFRTTRMCPDETGNVAKSEAFINFLAPLIIMLISVSLLCTTIAMEMKKIGDMTPDSFYIKWRTIIYLVLLLVVMVLEFAFSLELVELPKDDPANHTYEVLTDVLQITRAAVIFIFWGSKWVWKFLPQFWGLTDVPYSRQPTDDHSSPETEPAEPAIQPPSSQPGPSQAAGDAVSSPESEPQTPFEVIRSGWWKWKFPYPRPRSQSPAGVTVAPLTEAATTGPLQLSTTPSAGPSQLSSRSPRARPSRLSISPPRSGPSQPSTAPPAGPSRPSQLSTPPPRTEQPQLSSTPPTTGPPSTTSPARVERSPKTATTHSSAASSPTRASPVRALFGRTSPARTSAGSSSSSSPSSTPPRPSVHLISLNPAGPSEDLIAHEQESSV